MAMLLNRQKPMAVLALAWWPGGRTAQKATGSSPSITASTAATPAPAACRAALAEPGEVMVSMSIRRNGSVCGLSTRSISSLSWTRASSPSLAGGASRQSSWSG